MIEKNQIDEEEKFYDWNLKAILIENYPGLALNIFKTNFKYNFLNRKGHLRYFNFPHSVLNSLII